MLLQALIDQMPIKSHNSQESYYKTIVDPEDFNLDKDAFDDC